MIAVLAVAVLAVLMWAVLLYVLLAMPIRWFLGGGRRMGGRLASRPAAIASALPRSAKRRPSIAN